MSEYLPSFIVEPVLRQARRFSERVGGEDSPIGAPGSSFSLPAVPDFQRFYPTRFWSQSPLPAITADSQDLGEVALDQDSIVEEGTWRSIARNIQLWANQINNLDVEDEVIQEPVLPSVEHDDDPRAETEAVLTEEPEGVEPNEDILHFPPLEAVQDLGSPSLPQVERLRQPQRTSSETSINPAHELSYRSQIIEYNAQGRSQSDPLAAVNAAVAADSVGQEAPGQDLGDNVPRPRDGTGALPEDDGMQPLRQKINAVWAGPGNPQEKSKLVHSLMTERYRNLTNVTPTSSATVPSEHFRAASPFSLASLRSEDTVLNLSPADLERTYAPLHPDDGPDEITGEMPKPELGCLHYKRNVKKQCALCERWYTCRICHDEKEDHQLPRTETKHMLCMACGTPQRASQVCKTCHVQAAYYYCSICKLWNNDTNKSVYHCDDCGICRLGQGLGKDFFHCKTCAACMSIAAEATHRCIERSTKCDCPICGEFMFTSSLPVTFMRCGHSIHDSCFNEWCNTSYKCPICSKSIANMESQFRRLDRHIEDQPMPDEYNNNRAFVFCNDCNSRSVVNYHWLGLKCAVCDSYNTAQLELLGAESPAIQERADRAQELGVGEAGMTASQSQTPNDGLMSPASRPGTGQGTPSFTRQNSTGENPASSDTPRSAINIPSRRDSPFHNLPNSPSRPNRTRSPMVGSYFGTGQRLPPTENRRGSYFSVLSFGTATDDNPGPSINPRPQPSTDQNQNQNRSLNQSGSSHIPISLEAHAAAKENLLRGATPLEDDDHMDFWGGHSPRSHNADIVDGELAAEEEEESSSDEDDKMDYEEDDDDDEDPMDILIGHR